jgi:hypothetical protein
VDSDGTVSESVYVAGRPRPVDQKLELNPGNSPAGVNVTVTIQLEKSSRGELRSVGPGPRAENVVLPD